MVLEGLSLAVLTSGGLYLVYQALPLSVRLFIMRHQFMTRAGCAVFTYALFGGTLTALFAAAWLDLLVGTLLALSSKPETAAIMEALKHRISQMRQQLVDWITKTLAALPVNTTQTNQPENQAQLN
jgi:hypothetical protein